MSSRCGRRTCTAADSLGPAWPERRVPFYAVAQDRTPGEHRSSPIPVCSSAMTSSSETVRAVEGGVRIDIWVVPGSRLPGFDGLHDGAVRIRVAAPPEGGKANKEAARTVAAAIGCRRGRVVKGGSSRRKVVEVAGTDVATAIESLQERGVPV